MSVAMALVRSLKAEALKTAGLPGVRVGAALALGKPIALAQHHSVGQQSYLSDQLIATRTEVWRSEAELPAVVQRLVSNDSEIYQL